MKSDIDDLFTIDDLKVFLLLFADDAALFTHSPQALQSLLNDLHMYCSTWNLTVNTNKTKIMIFERGRHSTFDFVYNDTVLDVVHNFKYLGIYFFKNRSWSRTQKYIARHSQSALHNLFIVFNQLSLNIDDKCNLFDSLVGSVLNYSASIWGNHPCKNIELIHCKFMRKILGVKKSTNLDGLYGELGRYPMEINRKLLTVKFWIKIMEKPESSMVKKIYLMLKRDADADNNYNNLNWAYHVKQTLNEIGMTNLWLSQNGSNFLFKYIEQRITDIFKQKWYSNINNSARLESYSIYKHSFEREKYLECITSDKFRIALSKFRLSSHHLAIELGRHLNIPRENRLCPHCNQNMVENEYHFLLTCTKYYELRKQYLKKYYYQWPTINKFESLMSSKSTKTINNVARFIFAATKQNTEF